MTYPLIALLGLLNSKLFYIYLSNIGKKKGNMLELYATPLKHLLIKKLKHEKEIIKLSKNLIHEFNPIIFNELNQLIYDDYGISKAEISFIEKFYDKMH
jgi:adenine-specific DNA-methyltransferase